MQRVDQLDNHNTHMHQADIKTAQALSQVARGLYEGEPHWLIRTLQRYRPYICPFGAVAEHVPTGSRLLDVGCGAGLFVLLLERLERIERAVGFDISPEAVDAANRGAKRAGVSERIRFEALGADAPFPDGDFNVVSAIDVLHHVPPERQQTFVDRLCSAVPPGGRLIIKDMVDRPRWRSLANSFHDLVMARQWVHHLDEQSVAKGVEVRGFRLAHHTRINTLWYGHWLLVLDKPSD